MRQFFLLSELYLHTAKTTDSSVYLTLPNGDPVVYLTPRGVALCCIPQLNIFPCDRISQTKLSIWVDIFFTFLQLSKMALFLNLKLEYSWKLKTIFALFPLFPTKLKTKIQTQISISVCSKKFSPKNHYIEPELDEKNKTLKISWDCHFI